MSFEQDFFSQRLIKDVTVKVPLEMKADGNGYETITESDITDAINYDLRSVLLTVKGERFDGNFGVGIKHFLFEQVGSPKLGSLKREVTRQISMYMPWLSNFDVNINSNADGQVLFVDIKYKVNDANIIGHFNLSVQLSSL